MWKLLVHIIFIYFLVLILKIYGKKWKSFGAMDTVSEIWEGLRNFSQPLSRGNGVWSIMMRLVIPSTECQVWPERNARVHKTGTQSVDQVVQRTYDVVRLKLLSLKLMPTRITVKATEMWKLKEIQLFSWRSTLYIV